MNKMKWPSINEVAETLREENRVFGRKKTAGIIREEDDLEVRLRCFVGVYSLIVPVTMGWEILTGDPGYDPDHKGWWGAGTLDGKRFNSREMAREMLSQAKEQYEQEYIAEHAASITDGVETPEKHGGLSGVLPPHFDPPSAPTNPINSGPLTLGDLIKEKMPGLVKAVERNG